MKKTVLIALLCIILMTSSAFAGVVEDAQSDYQWKLSLVTEQTQRLDMWYATNAGKEITEGSLSYLKSRTDEFVLRENNAIESGRKYRNALIGNIDNYNREWVLAEINRTEKNEEISSNDREITIKNYEITKTNYERQQESIKKAAEAIQKRSRELEEITKPKEILQDITLGALDETRTIKASGYLVYSFLGDKGEKINVNLEVINGEAIDVFIMDSSGFTDFQSMMLGGSSEEFSSLATGQGRNVKSKSYTFTFDHTDRYYIVVDNSIQPAGGAKPSGQVDVKIKIVKEEPISSKSTPGFEAFYSVLILVAFFCLPKKR